MNRRIGPPKRRRIVPLIATAGLSAVLTIGVFGALGHLRAPRIGARSVSVPASAIVAPGAGPAPREVGNGPVAALPPIAATSSSLPSPPTPAGPKPVRLSVVTRWLERDQTLAHALFGLNLDGTEVNAVIAALTDLFPFRRARPGDQLRLERAESDGALRRLTYRQSAADEWIVEPGASGVLEGRKRPVELKTEVANVIVNIESSLYESMEKVGEDTSLAVNAADVFAWDVDFYRDVRSGDSMRIIVEKIFVDGRFLRYGEVLAAEYQGSSVGRKRLFRYTDPSGQTSYFDDNGTSVRRGFLKSPLKYARVTSGFGMRKHPVLGYTRAHQGVDYGAPTGTPVWAVGDGSVVQAGWSGGCGKAIMLRHRNGLETQYCHLSTIQVRAGARVSQKQVIGLVGSTGLSTGPHLHYGVKQNGHHINPLSLKMPRDAPVPSQYRADFQEKIAPLRHDLDAIPIAMLPRG